MLGGETKGGGSGTGEEREEVGYNQIFLKM